ncbi:MAG: hypothetical protein CME70_22525 [Halobacteriovorax sp.]|nr:hypothetical protein [Halobacteriovorax sp.]|tara:strand:- start:63412 stop:63894 length:483 start_codon:yes stop_codon:yes gene_type:complete
MNCPVFRSSKIAPTHSLTNVLSIHESRHRKQSVKRVMVIDDSLDCLEAIRVLLAEYKFLELETFESEANAFREFSHYEPDLIILDLNLNKISGIEVAKIFKKISPFNIPIVFISNDSDAKSEIEIKLGREITFVKKPLNENFLINAINDLLNFPNVAEVA